MHWTAVKRIFRYLKYTKNAQLTYRGNDAEINNTKLNFFCDANWGNGPDQKSISGYVTIIDRGVVARSSKKQQLWRYPQPRPSISLPLMSLSRYYGTDPYTQNLNFHSQQHLLYSLTIKQLLQFHITQNSMRVQSILI